MDFCDKFRTIYQGPHHIVSALLQHIDLVHLWTPL